MTEKWLPVVSFDGMFINVYEVSDHGRVKSLARTDRLGRPVAKRILKQKLIGSSGKRFAVCLNKDGTTKTAYVHVLMLESFVGPRPAGMLGCHIDDTTRNELSNLKWDSYSGNAFDQVRNGRHARAKRTHCKRSGHELTPENVYIHPSTKARMCRTCMKEYPSVAAAAKRRKEKRALERKSKEGEHQ